jgi:hypothetical protein
VLTLIDKIYMLSRRTNVGVLYESIVDIHWLYRLAADPEVEWMAVSYMRSICSHGSDLKHECGDAVDFSSFRGW